MLVMAWGDNYKFLGRFPNLKYLNLSEGIISLKTVHHMLHCIPTHLTHLILTDCAIRSESDNGLFNKIANLPSVQKLVHFDIEANILTIFGDFMELLKRCHKTLSFLNLKDNDLNDGCVKYITQLLEPPFALETLLIGDNEFSLEAQRLLYKKDTMGRIKDHNLEVVVESE